MRVSRLAAAAILTAVLLGAAGARAEEFSEVEYYAQQAREAELARQAQETPAALPAQQYAATRIYLAEECEDGPPSGAFVVIPQYFNSRAGKASGFKVGGTRLKSEKSKAHGSGVTVLFNKRLNDVVSLGFMYEYAFMKISGGMAVADVPGAPALRGTDDSRYHSHVVGFLPEFNFREYGKLQLSVIQGFDRPSGHETVYNGANGPVDRRSTDKYGTNVTSLMAWYEKDFALGCNWKLTPYAGWRSLYVDVKDANNWSQANPAAADYRMDDNTWIHLVSAGLKIGYQCGDFGFHVRGGVNHRTSGDDLPGYGNRATAPGVVHFSHRANQDRTVGTVGAGISYRASRRLIISAGYDGFYGRDTSAHMGSLAFSLPF